MSRKNKPCGRSGSISPDAARDAERRALDERDDAVGTAEGRARARRPRLGHRERTLARYSPLLTERRASPYPATMRIAIVAPGLVSRPAGRIRRHRARRRAAGRRPRRRRPRRHAVRGGRLDRPRPTLVTTLAEPPEPRELGNPWYDAYHALSSYLRVDGFDVVHDHAGDRRPGVRGDAARATRRSCTPCTARGPSRSAAALQRSSTRHVHLVAISDAQARRQP